MKIGNTKYFLWNLKSKKGDDSLMETVSVGVAFELITPEWLCER